MNWNDRIKLGKTREVIVHGEPLRKTLWTYHYANKKSVRQSEFYEMARLGLKPELMFEVHSHEYQDHELLWYDRKQYEIVRAYDRGEVTELTVKGEVGRVVGGDYLG